MEYRFECIQTNNLNQMQFVKHYLVNKRNKMIP